MTWNEKKPLKNFALRQLFENPQNNLRLFIDGQFVYGMETSEQLSIKCMSTVLEQMCAQHGAQISYERMLGLLCRQIGSVDLAESKFCKVSSIQKKLLQKIIFSNKIFTVF